MDWLSKPKVFFEGINFATTADLIKELVPTIDRTVAPKVDTSAPKELGDLEASVTNLSLPATAPVELLIKN